ncbi:hypothetical protein KUCAC02_017696, partial [Chaenocephalus aceratus]
PDSPPWACFPTPGKLGIPGLTFAKGDYLTTSTSSSFREGCLGLATQSHPAGSPCSTFHPERNYVPPHFRRKTVVWCYILETCESCVRERVAWHGSRGPLKVST